MVPTTTETELEYADRVKSEQTTDEKLDELLSLLRPLGPLMESLPDMIEKVGPFIDGLKDSPVIKMLGIKL